MRYIAPIPDDSSITKKSLEKSISHQEEHGFSMWAVMMNATFVGRAGLWFLERTTDVELGYMLHEKFWGRGLGTEIAQRCLRFGLEEIHLDEVVAVTRPMNWPSRAILEKVGMNYVRDDWYYGGPVALFSKRR